MAKPSGMMQRQQNEIKAAVELAKRWNRGLCQDVACLTAKRVFGIGPKRILEFMAVYCQMLEEVDAMLKQDRKEDRSMTYSKQKWDETMRSVYELPGEDSWMPEFDIRMGQKLLDKKQEREPLTISARQAEIFLRNRGEQE